MRDLYRTSDALTLSATAMAPAMGKSLNPKKRSASGFQTGPWENEMNSASADDRTGAAPSKEGLRNQVSARYAITILMFSYALNFVDRQIVNILAEPIKNSLKLADWQIGMMTGFAFAVFYTFFGIPIAKMAEVKNRPRIIAAAITCWSGFTVLCGVAQTFSLLLLARVGVGMGEAGCTPPAHSLISDYVPREKRASAIAFYGIGGPVGSLIGLAMGGLVADLYGWRTAFFVAGAPGLVIALLVALTLREPRSAGPKPRAAGSPEQPNFLQTLAYLSKKRSFWLITFGVAMNSFIGYGHGPFAAAFFFRVHGRELTTLAALVHLKAAGLLGLVLGVIGGTSGILGAWVGGQLADGAAKHDVRGYAVIPAVAALFIMPFTVAMFSVPSLLAAFALMVVPSVLGGFWYGPAHAAQLSVVPANMRATTIALVAFIVNIIGLGLGPLLVGFTSDLLSGPFRLGPAEGVRWALIGSTFLGFATFALFWSARSTLVADVES